MLLNKDARQICGICIMRRVRSRSCVPLSSTGNSLLRRSSAQRECNQVESVLKKANETEATVEEAYNESDALSESVTDGEARRVGNA